MGNNFFYQFVNVSELLLGQINVFDIFNVIVVF